MTRKLVWPAVLLGALSIATTASALPCASSDVLDTMPPDGAEHVPVNATLSARYTQSAEYLGEDVVLESANGDQTIELATFDSAEGLLSITPSTALVPGDPYTVHWPGLRGRNTASVGRGKDATFFVGNGEDTGPPSFEGLRRVDWDVARESDDCTDTLEDRYVFDLDLGTADDDGGRESLALLVFQTKGPSVPEGSPPTELAIELIPAASDPAKVRLSKRDSLGKVCFAAAVRDLVGQISASANHEVCTKTVATPFFYGCALAPRRVRSPGGSFGALVL
ncbi:MAG TPA: hypothetical protein VGP93_00440, partial [Polyangiaceae bacterium]|nr:hypothetical protein [Polyangiaceae bacterium]